MLKGRFAGLKYKKENPNAEHSDAIKHVSELAKQQRDPMAKMAMISAASHALTMKAKNPSLVEKELVARVMKEFPRIIQENFMAEEN